MLEQARKRIEPVDFDVLLTTDSLPGRCVPCYATKQLRGRGECAQLACHGQMCFERLKSPWLKFPSHPPQRPPNLTSTPAICWCCMPSDGKRLLAESLARQESGWPLVSARIESPRCARDWNPESGSGRAGAPVQDQRQYKELNWRVSSMHPWPMTVRAAARQRAACWLAVVISRSECSESPRVRVRAPPSAGHLVAERVTRRRKTVVFLAQSRCESDPLFVQQDSTWLLFWKPKTKN